MPANYNSGEFESCDGQSDEPMYVSPSCKDEDFADILSSFIGVYTSRRMARRALSIMAKLTRLRLTRQLPRPIAGHSRPSLLLRILLQEARLAGILITSAFTRLARRCRFLQYIFAFPRRNCPRSLLKSLACHSHRSTSPSPYPTHCIHTP